VLGVQRRPSIGAVAWAGGFTTLSLLSRVSVGLGPLVALGFVLLVALVRLLRHRRTAEREPDPGARRVVIALVVACVVPVGLYAAVNEVKFGEPFRLPLEKQVFSQIDPARQAALDANGGSLFSAGYLPSTLWQYSRPDALDIDGLAPWINFPRQPATVIGDATFDTRDESSSVPATMPLLTVLSVIALVAIARDAWRREWRLGPLIVPVVGAAAGCVGVLVIGFIANRYLGDLFPLVALLALTGVEVVARWLVSQKVVIKRLVVLDLALLGLWGVLANLALSIEYQRLIAPVDDQTRWAFLAVQRGDDFTTRTVAFESLPEVGPRGSVVVVRRGGGCAPYWSAGFAWYEVPGATCTAGGSDSARVELSP
jgi:hypothetical protein